MLETGRMVVNRDPASARDRGEEARVLQTVGKTGAPNNRRDETVTGLIRGLDVLRAFDRESPAMTLSQVAAKAKLPPAAARRYLRTLVGLGYLAQHGRLFVLRPKVLELGTHYLDAVDVNGLCQADLQEVVAATGHSSSLAILDGEEIVYLAHAGVRRRFRAEANVGARYPAHATSMGRVLLADLDERALRDYLATARFERLTERTVIAPGALGALIMQARTDGHALVCDELFYGVIAVAVPVREPSGRVIAAINCSARSPETAGAVMVATCLPVLHAAAERIGQALRRFPALSLSVRLSA